MTPTTAYRLPYAVSFGALPVLASGEDVVFEVVGHHPMTPAAVDDLDSLVLPFVLLAQSGALAGVRIDPAASSIADKSAPQVHDRAAWWLLAKCKVDDFAIGMLAHMLLPVHADHPLTELRFTSRLSGPATQPLASGADGRTSFPGPFGDPGFVVQREPETGREVAVSMLFAEAPDAQLRSRIESEVTAWFTGLMAGAYGVAPVAPDECTAAPDLPMAWFGPELRLALTRLMAHPGAFDGLINACTAIHRRLAPVVELWIE